MSFLFIYLINIYQSWISIFIVPSCRFYPSCSEYTKQAFQKYSIWKAFYLGIKRLLKCQPFHIGGYDPLL